MTLLEEIDRFQRATGISDSAFGKRAIGDPALVGCIRRGKIVRPRNHLRCLEFIAAEVARFKAQYP